MLIMTDLQIEQGYILIYKGKMKEAVRYFRDAEQKITRTGYRRREREVLEYLATGQDEVVVLSHNVESHKNCVIERKNLQANCFRYRACAASA
jgi:hypothetical protein